MTTNQRTAGRSGSGDLVELWTRLAGTANLVCRLTTLADRYEAAIAAGDRQAEEGRPLVVLMRVAAEAGRKLLRSHAPAASPVAEQPTATELQRSDRARSRDLEASARDAAAQVRDERATQRDVLVRAVLGDGDLDFAGRFLAACDRDSAAGDRADSLADRRASQRDREAHATTMNLTPQARAFSLVTRLEERAIVRQAQGILMARAGLSADEALQALLTGTEPMTVDDVDAGVRDRAGLPSGHVIP